MLLWIQNNLAFPLWLCQPWNCWTASNAREGPQHWRLAGGLAGLGGLAINENEDSSRWVCPLIRVVGSLGHWVIGSCGLKFRCIFDALIRWIRFAWKIRSSCVLSRSRRSERANWQIEQIEQRIWAKFGSKGPTQTLSTRCIPVLHGIFHTSCRLGAAAA